MVKPTGRQHARGIRPVILRCENSQRRGRFFPEHRYKLRARIERTIGKLKRFRRVTMRCENQRLSHNQFCLRTDAG